MLDFWFLPATKLSLFPFPSWPQYLALSSLFLAMIRILITHYLKQLEEQLLLDSFNI